MNFSGVTFYLKATVQYCGAVYEKVALSCEHVDEK